LKKQLKSYWSMNKDFCIHALGMSFQALIFLLLFFCFLGSEYSTLLNYSELIVVLLELSDYTNIRIIQSWWYSSMIDCLPSTWKDLVSK
jgi:hypothetical protein